MTRSIIVLEFNELTPALMDRFISEGRLPAFKRLRDQSLVAVTDAEEQPPYLEPWIQWETVHTGRPYAEHGVFELGQGAHVRHPRVWDVVSAAGRPVWVCGSMNATAHGGRLNGRLLSDPWSNETAAVPAAMFRPFVHLVNTFVQEHSREDVPLSKMDFARFGWFMLTNGLSPRTVADTLAQLASERRGGHRWRRATILDRLQWDVFKHHYRRVRPALATFFLNSTAHFQHFHWRNMEPEAFQVRPSAADQAEYADAILSGYIKMDAIIDECLSLADAETTLVLCTALGQQPMTKYEETSGKALFRPVDVDALVRFAGVSGPYAHEPVMADEFHLSFDSAEAAQAAEAKLLSLRLDGDRTFMRSRRTDAKLLVSGFPTFAVSPDDHVRSLASNQTLAFGALFYPLGATSGMHHPDGILWIRGPGHTHAVVDRKVSLREIAPTLLSVLGLDAAAHYPAPPMAEAVALWNAGAAPPPAALAAE